MHIALAQINPVIGDFSYNADKIAAAAAEAKTKIWSNGLSQEIIQNNNK